MAHLEMADDDMQVLLGGLIAQLVSFVTFTFVYGVFLYRVWWHNPTTWHWGSGQPWYQRWHALAAAPAISCVGILVRDLHCAEVETETSTRSGLHSGSPSFQRDSKAN